MDRNDRRGRGRDDDGDDRGSRRGRDDDRGRGRDRDDDRGDRGGRRGSSRFEYHKRDDSSARKRAESSGRDFDRYIKDVSGIGAFAVKDGDNVVRILPPTWNDAEHYGYDIYVHYEIGPDKGTYLCLNKMKGEKCPICEERKRAQNDGDEEYAKKLEPKKRVLTYVIDRNNEKEGIKVWAMPWTLDRDIVKVSVDKRNGEVMAIDHPEDGYDVMFERQGKGARTEYVGVSIDRRSSPLDNDKALDIAQEHPLPGLLQFYSYDHISNVFGGGSSSSSTREDRRDSDRSSDRRGDRDDRDNDDRGRSSSRDRGRDEPRGGGRGSRSEPESDDLTWEQIHEMSYDELVDLIDANKLDVDPDKSKDDEDLADWICEEMKIEKEEKTTRRSSRDSDPDDDDDRSSARRRLDSMRRSRE